MLVDVMAIGSEGTEDRSRPEQVDEYAINICGSGMPAAVLQQANNLRWLGSAQYELAGLLLLATGQTSFAATLEFELADGRVETREVEDYSFVQAHINMHMGKRVCFAPSAQMDDGLLDVVLIQSSDGLDILHANALARGSVHVDLPFVEVLRCRSLAVRPQGEASSAINLDGELRPECAPFRATCVQGALDVYTSQLNTQRMDTSDELEPRLVMKLLQLAGRA